MRFVLSFLVAATLNVNAQNLPVDSVSGKITFTGVVQVDSASADELYSRALLWFAATFKSAGAAIDLSDRQAGVITTDPGTNFKAYYTRNNGTSIDDGHIKFKLKVECKEGRYRYTLTDLEHAGSKCSGGALEAQGSVCFWKNLWASLKTNAGKSAAALISSLDAAMQKRPNAASGDW